MSKDDEIAGYLHCLLDHRRTCELSECFPCEALQGILDFMRQRLIHEATIDPSDAERILVEDVGGVFIYHRTIADLYKPFLKGSELEKDKNGFSAMHWPGYANFSTLVGSMYVSKDVPAGRKTG